MHDNLTAAFMAGQGAPDLVDIEIGKFARFVKTEDNVHLLDLTDVVAPYLPDLVATRMAPYQAFGKQLGIDYHLGAYLMYYNKALLDEAGIDPDAIKTWDDYVAAGKQFQEKFPDKAWTAVASNDIFSAYGLMYMNGGHVYDADGNLVLNSPENVEALQFMSDLVHVEGVAIPAPGGGIVNNPEFNAAFANGEIASFWMPQWMHDAVPGQHGRPLRQHDRAADAPLRGGRLHDDDGWRHGHGRDRPDRRRRSRSLAKEFLAFAKLTYDAQKALYTDLGFDPYRPDVYEDPDPARDR